MFSVIIPTFNRLPFLRKAVASVLEQTFSNLELIIVDDGSDDGTRAFLEELRVVDSRLRVICQENHGVAHARNQGIDTAQGEWIAFLDSDDWWMPKKLERVRAFIEQFNDIRIFHTEEEWYRRGQRLNPKQKHKKPDGRVYTDALPLCCISISTAVLHCTVIDDIGGFDESLPACEDYDFWLRAANRYDVKLIPEYLTGKDGGRPDQLSAQWGLDRWRIQALIKILQSGTLSPGDYADTLRTVKQKAVVYINGARKRGRVDEALRYQNCIAGIKKIQL